MAKMVVMEREDPVVLMVQQAFQGLPVLPV